MDTKQELSSTFEPDAPIRFAVKNKDFELAPKQIDSLFHDIEKYNEQFSMGSMLAKSIFHVIQFDDE